MGKLVFQAADVRRVVEHSLANGQTKITDWSGANEKNGWKTTQKVPTEANVILVHDQGVYLMSNGTPRDLIDGADQEKGRSFCAYAKGCDPEKDKDDWWDKSRELVGGDDFGEYLPWAADVKKMLDAGATQIVIGFGRKVSLSAVYPKGKGPVPGKCSLEEYVKRLQRSMRTKIAAKLPDSPKIQLYKATPTTENLARFRRQKPNATILNGMPFDQFVGIAKESLAA